ncbi:hypothetical protein IIA15_00420, partial [candidate division TA06 bacterium]|nr:hypothetical protein [candidate division TA06 bacterium]
MKRFLLTLLLIFSVPSTAYSVHTILSVGDSKLDIRDAAGNSQLRVDPLTGGGFWNIKEGGLLRIGPTNINQPNTDVQIGSAGAGSSTSLHGNISFLGASVTNISPFILLHRLSLSIPGETGELRFGELFPAANYIGFKAPDSVPADLIWTLPPSDGTSGQVLSTDGSGILSWTTDSEGVTNHGALAGLADDDHTQYALLSGRTGGQTLVGPLIITDPFSATGGVKTTSGDFTVHTFTSSGTFAPNGPGNVEVLVVGAGGGSLGGGAGGGGG